jgi:hypothetical protein
MMHIALSQLHTAAAVRKTVRIGLFGKFAMLWASVSPRSFAPGAGMLI